MKGILILGGRDLIFRKYGKETWDKVKELCGFNQNIILPMKDIEDEKVLCILSQLSEILRIPLDKIIEDFGFAWTSKIAPEEYPTFFETHKNLYDFLININNIHRIVTSNMKNVNPPTFEISTHNSKEIIMKYISTRKMSPLVKGALLGAADFYKENISVLQINEDTFRILFL